MARLIIFGSAVAFDFLRLAAGFAFFMTVGFLAVFGMLCFIAGFAIFFGGVNDIGFLLAEPVSAGGLSAAGAAPAASRTTAAMASGMPIVFPMMIMFRISSARRPIR